MRIFAYYDFYTEAIRPLQLIIRMDSYQFDWSAILYLPVTGPLHRLEAEDFGDLTSISVLLSDLTREPKNTQLIGINLPQIAHRHGTEAEQLILQLDDVEEVLGLNVNIE